MAAKSREGRNSGKGREEKETEAVGLKGEKNTETQTDRYAHIHTHTNTHTHTHTHTRTGKVLFPLLQREAGVFERERSDGGFKLAQFRAERFHGERSRDDFRFGHVF